MHGTMFLAVKTFPKTDPPQAEASTRAGVHGNAPLAQSPVRSRVRDAHAASAAARASRVTRYGWARMGGKAGAGYVSNWHARTE
ncbi:MAG TPA: hypothetical protein VGI16_04910 [Candidatus Acidoferrum sp.]